MGTPTQVPGTISETAALAQTNGFIGWSATTDRTSSTLLGGTTYRGAYANSTAYAVGDVVTYGGDTYTALQAVSSANTTAPVVGPVWRQASNKRGPAQVQDAVSRIPHFYR